MPKHSEYNKDIIIDIINVIKSDEKVEDIEDSIIITSKKFFNEKFDEIMRNNNLNIYDSLLELIDRYSLCVDDIKTIVSKFIDKGHIKLIEDYVKEKGLHKEKKDNKTVKLF